jgi:outer membrane receptor protein involved in Fe transport
LVVTATKREKSVETIPAAISVISSKEIADRGIQNLAQIVELTPGVNLTTPADNADRITIRGIASEANTNPTAGILYGDISLEDAYVPHFTLNPNPFDMQDVEVLKGPQGTLFGASALNGAIRFVPQPPNMTEFGGKYYVQGSAVSEGGDGGSIGGVLNIPIIKDQLAIRIVADGSELPGWVDNLRTGQKNANRGSQNGQRVILEWKPTNRFDAQLTFNRQAVSYDDTPDTDNLNGQLSAADRPRASPWHDEYDLVSLRMNYDAGAFTFVSDTGYIYKTYYEFGEGSGEAIPGGAYPIIATVSHQYSNSYSQEFRFVSNDTPDSKWSWVAGAFASRQDIWQDGAYQLGSPTLSPEFTASLLDLIAPELGNVWLELGQPDYQNGHIDVRVDELAGFFNVTRKLGDGFELTLGGRVYGTSSGGLVVNSGLALDYNALITTGVPSAVQVLNDTVKDSGFNPSASLSWRPTEGIMFYAAVARGYRVGGVQWGVSGLLGSAPAPSTFKTDTIWNYETGLRARLFDNTLQFDLTGFYERWKNPQVLVFIAGGAEGAYIDNVGGVISEGVETSLQYHAPFLPGLILKASATYNDAYTTTDFVSVGASLPKGSPWPLAPKWQTATTLSYDHSLKDWSWGAYVTDAFISHAIYGVNQPNVVFGYHQVDAQIHVQAPHLPLRPELALTVTNIGDVRGITTSYSGAFWNEVTYIQPRTFTLRISGSF